MINTKVKIAKNIIKSTLKLSRNPLIFWTGGKDSTLMLRLLMDFEKEYNIVFLDSGKEFPEIYRFIEKTAKEWDFKYFTFKYLAPDAQSARENKIEAINDAIESLNPDYVYVGIRWDEHKSRSKELYIRKDENVFRVHPILHFTEEDIWTVTRNTNIPYCELYDEGYRSLGEAPFTHKSDKSERSGRDQDKEEQMNKLRKLGYF
ncbi:MAG: PAPS reductase [Podoviridae sp. ctg2L5]|nr:MAG: PAPS reductase [Podoviridae sp. ctg2L5]